MFFDLAVLVYYKMEAIDFHSSLLYLVVAEMSNKKQITVIAWRYNLLILLMEYIYKCLKGRYLLKVVQQLMKLVCYTAKDSSMVQYKVKGECFFRYSGNFLKEQETFEVKLFPALFGGWQIGSSVGCRRALYSFGTRRGR